MAVRSFLETFSTNRKQLIDKIITNDFVSTNLGGKDPHWRQRNLNQWLYMYMKRAHIQKENNYSMLLWIWQLIKVQLRTLQWHLWFEIKKIMKEAWCLQSHLQTSAPTPQKSYQKFWNPGTTFENTPLCAPHIPIVRGKWGVPDFLCWVES